MSQDNWWESSPVVEEQDNWWADSPVVDEPQAAEVAETAESATPQRLADADEVRIRAESAPAQAAESVEPAAPEDPADYGIKDFGKDVAATAAKAPLFMGQSLYGVLNTATELNPVRQAGLFAQRKGIDVPIVPSIDSALESVNLQPDFGRTVEAADEIHSDAIKQSKAEIEASAKAREKAGAVDKFLGTVGDYVKHPGLTAQMAAEQAGSFLMAGGAARAAVKSLGVEVSEEVARRVGGRVALAMGSGMEAGAAAQEVNEILKSMDESDLIKSDKFVELRRNGLSVDEAKAQMASMAQIEAAGIAATISAVAGKVTGAPQLESDILTRQLPGALSKRVAGTAGAAAKEGVQGAIEEGGSQFGSNVGLKHGAGFQDVDLSSGVAEAAGAGAVLEAGMGGAARLLAPGRIEQNADESPQAESETPSPQDFSPDLVNLINQKAAEQDTAEPDYESAVFDVDDAELQRVSPRYAKLREVVGERAAKTELWGEIDAARQQERAQAGEVTGSNPSDIITPEPPEQQAQPEQPQQTSTYDELDGQFDQPATTEAQPQDQAPATGTQAERDQKIDEFFAGVDAETAQSNDSQEAEAPQAKDSQPEVAGQEQLDQENDDGFNPDLVRNLPKGTTVGGSRDIGDLYDQTIAGSSNEKKAVRFDAVSPEAAEKLKSETGVDTAGYTHVVDNYAVRHAVKSHGNQSTEDSRGQEAIAREDFEKIPDIVRNYDEATGIGNDQQGNPLIQYKKRYNGTTYYVVEARNKRGELAAKTIWKTRTATDAAPKAPADLNVQDDSRNLPDAAAAESQITQDQQDNQPELEQGTAANESDPAPINEPQEPANVQSTGVPSPAERSAGSESGDAIGVPADSGRAGVPEPAGGERGTTDTVTPRGRDGAPAPVGERAGEQSGELTREEEEAENRKAEESQRRSVAAKERVARQLKPDPTIDDLVLFIRKKGGIDVNEESDVRGRLIHLNRGYAGQSIPIGTPGIERKGYGMLLDDAAELAYEAGYIEKQDVNELLDKLMDAELTPHYSRNRRESEIAREQDIAMRHAFGEDEITAGQSDAILELFGLDSLEDREMVSFYDQANTINPSAVEAIEPGLSDNAYIERLLEIIYEWQSEQQGTPETANSEYSEYEQQGASDAGRVRANPEGESGGQGDEQAARNQPSESSEEFRLTEQTEESRREAEERLEAKRLADEADRREAEQRAQAEKDVDDFRLSGSNAPADRAASYGQADLLGATGESKSPESTPTDGETSDNPEPIEKGDRYGGFLDGKSAMQQGRIKKALEKEVRFNDGAPSSIKAKIDSLLAAGELAVDTVEEPRVKPMSRRKFNQSTNEEQAAHEKRMREAGNKTVYYVNDFDLGKTAYEYAKYLLESDNSAATTTSETTQENEGTENAPSISSEDPEAAVKKAKREAELRELSREDHWSDKNWIAPQARKNYRTQAAAKLELDRFPEDGEFARDEYGIVKEGDGFVIRPYRAEGTSRGALRYEWLDTDKASEKRTQARKSLMEEKGLVEDPWGNMVKPEDLPQAQAEFEDENQAGQPAEDSRDETVSEEVARGRFVWQDMGTEGGVKTQRLQYEGMAYGDLEKSGRGKWGMDGERFDSLRKAKKAAEDKAIDRLRADGLVEAANDDHLTPESVSGMKMGDVIRDADGNEYIMLSARQSHKFVEVAPIVDGKASVSADTTFKFHLDPDSQERYPERRPGPVYAVGRNHYAEQEKAKEADPDEFPTKEIADSYAHISHSTGDRGRMEKEWFDRALVVMREQHEKLALNDEQKALLEERLKEFRRKYISKARDVAKVRSETVSSHVAGRANFNTGQANRRGNALDRATERFTDWQKNFAFTLKKDLLKARTPEQREADNKKESDKAFAKLRAKVLDSVASVRAIDEGKMPGFDRASFTAGAVRKLEAMGEEDARRILTEIRDKQGEWKKPIFTKRHGIWNKLGVDFDPPAKAEPSKAAEAAPEATEKPAEPQGALEFIGDVVIRMREGTAKVDEYKQAFKQATENEAELRADLDKRTKKDLLTMLGPMAAYRVKGENKAKIVDAVYEGIVNDFALGNDYREGAYFLHEYDKVREREAAKLKAIVEAQTQETLDAFAADFIKEAEARKAATQARLEGAKNPETLDQFADYFRMQKMEGMDEQEARLALTPAQRIKYDELLAEQSRSNRQKAKTEQRTTVRAAGEKVDAEIIETKHTRDGYDLWVVQLGDRVERDDFNTLRTSARRLGGWWSSYKRNGATPGFQFKDKDSAEAFAKLVAGDTSEASDMAKERRSVFEDDRSQSAAERLRTMASRLQERAEQSLDQDRKTNTAKRAAQAASAEASAEADRAFAVTMNAIADAIESGDAKFLDQVREKKQLELLNSHLHVARGDERRAKYDSYMEQEKHKGEPPTAETADYARYPKFWAFRSDLAALARQMQEVDGLKQMGAKLASVADDVTSAYIEWAKENFNKVARYTKSDGSLASFRNKGEAERALRRGGFKGKAIVLPLKRGQNVIILSPSEAIGQGLWDGDADKRITLTNAFGRELVEKVSRRASGVSIPHWFNVANEQQKAFARMGIESPAEFRSALREYIAMRTPPKAPDRVKELERAMVGRRKDDLDFFPTPANIADTMIGVSGLEEGMTVLEPSAGMGHIAEQIREAGVDPDVMEFDASRRELLEAKGFNVLDTIDFLKLGGNPIQGEIDSLVEKRSKMQERHMEKYRDGSATRAQTTTHNARVTDLNEQIDALRNELKNQPSYDRIIMNPPFSKHRDIDHVQHAYSLLKPGGRLVAIMGEGAFFNSSKKAEGFRDWLEDVGGTSEKLGENTFMDPSLPVTTGVNARMVVIDKLADDGPQLSMSPESSGKGIPLERAQREVDRFVERFGEGVRGLRFSVEPDKHTAFGSAAPAGRVKAAYYPRSGRVVVVANGVDSAPEVHKALLHEVLGHFGLNTLPPDVKAEILAQIRATRDNKAFAAAWKEIDRDYDGDTEQGKAEEIFAKAAESSDNVFLQAFDKLMQKIAAILRKHGLMPENTLWRMSELREMTRQIAKGIKENASVEPSDKDDPLFKRAYHGSPHKFDKFSLDAMGSGEGAQAYGWGLYFAERRSIAEWYRDTVSYADVVRNFRRELPDNAGLDEVSELARKGQFSHELNDLVKALAADDWLGFDYPAQAITAAFDDLDSFDPSDKLRKAVRNAAGHLYQVDIPEDNELLDWDAPLSEQPAEVIEALESYIERMAARKNGNIFLTDQWVQSLAEMLKDAENVKGYELYSDFSDRYRKGHENQRLASELLGSIGIKGLRYRDNQSRRAMQDPNATRNYVIWEEDSVTVEAVNDELAQAEEAKFSVTNDTATKDAPITPDITANDGGGSKGPITPRDKPQEVNTPPEIPQLDFFPKIPSMLDGLEGIKRTYEGAAEMLERTPGLERVGRAVKMYFDRAQKYQGDVAKLMDKPMKDAFGIKAKAKRWWFNPREILNSLKGESKVEKEFEAWARAWDRESAATAKQAYESASPEAKGLIEAWMKIARVTGDKLDAAGVEVFDPKINGWRKMGRVKRFFPRVLKPEYEEAMRDQEAHPITWAAMVRELIKSGHIQDESEANKYVTTQRQRPVQMEGDYFAGVERARTEGFPESLYDHRFARAVEYLTRWGDRLAQIESFGQKHKDGDIFDKAQRGIQDQNTKNYLNSLAETIYGTGVRNNYKQGMAFANQLATGLMLGNPGTATLNLIGGLTLNNIAYGADALKAYADLRHAAAAMKDARALGIINDDYMRLIHDADGLTPKWLPKATTMLMKIGGYTPTERLIRLHAFLSGRRKLDGALEAWFKDLNSAKSRREIAWFKQNGFDPSVLMEEAVNVTEDGRRTGQEIDRFLRYAVNLTQGSYKVDQVPLWTDTPEGRFLFKYWKYGNQLSRMFVKNHLEPFTKAIRNKDKTQLVRNPITGKWVSTKTPRVQTLMPMLRYFALGSVGGLAIMTFRAFLFGYNEAGPDDDELERALQDDDTAKAVALGMQIAFEGMLALGGIGVLTTPYQWTKDFRERKRSYDPTDPPGIAIFRETFELAQKSFDQGGLTEGDIQHYAESIMSIVRTARRATTYLAGLSGSTADAAQMEVAQRDRKYAKRMMRRFAQNSGLVSKSSGGNFRSNKNTPIKRAVSDALYLGQPEKAKTLVRQHLDGLMTTGEVESAYRSIKSGVRYRQPLFLYENPSNDVRRDFLDWAKDNLTQDGMARINHIDDKYRKSAIEAGLMTEENERRIATNKRKDAEDEMHLTRRERQRFYKRNGIAVP